MEGDATKKYGKIECVYRKYHVHIPGGSILEMESVKPISEEGTKKLLEEDSGITDFLNHYKIIGYLHQVPLQKKDSKENDSRPESNDVLTPLQRINLLLEMKGEFTRDGYAEYMKGLKYDVTKWMAHVDFNNALELKRLELVDNTKRACRYKVIDSTPVDESLFKQLLRDRRLQAGETQ